MFENQFERELHLHGAGATYHLENRLKEMFKKKYCILTCSATAALEVTCHCLKITDKLIYTSAYQWPGMLVPFLNRNNKLFLGYYCNAFHTGFDNKTKFDVMFIVDSFGIAQNGQYSYQKYCKRNNCIYIHDASSSASSIAFDHTHTGSLADVVITSFGPQKPFFGGEGGAILTDNEFWYKKMVLYTEHPYRHISEGFSKNLFVHNFRMNPLGIIHLEEKFEDYLNEIHKKRIVYKKTYNNLLNNDLIGMNGPYYTEDNSTFSSFIVELKDIALIPENLKIVKRHLEPVFSYPFPRGMGKTCFLNKKNSLLDYDLVALELKDYGHDPSL
jgi:dTDP-4-amino-4,6-dideoxygalactose transaminase